MEPNKNSNWENRVRKALHVESFKAYKDSFYHMGQTFFEERNQILIYSSKMKLLKQKKKKLWLEHIV